MNKPGIKVLIAKVGLDGHDRGAKLLCRFLREGGMEVIYTGIHQTPESISTIAVQEEDVDVIGVSILSGAHNFFIPRILNELKKNNLSIPVILGGIIPENDVTLLMNLGIAKVYLPGSSFNQIKNDIQAMCDKRTA